MREIVRVLGIELALLLPIFFGLVIWAEAAERCAGRSGLASWYGSESGSVTASGAKFNPGGLTMAMRSRDFGVRYRVRFGSRSVIVTHTDFGPSAKMRPRRDFDLSHGAAAAIGLTRQGVGRVCVERLGR